jgi:iron uptake system component EfeO
MRGGRIAVVAAVVASGAFLLVACGGDDSGGSATQTVGVESSNTACTPAESTVKAGAVRFNVKNTGSAATELYVYDGDKILGEVENVGPGTSRTLTVTMQPGGSYTLRCKPGQ